MATYEAQTRWEGLSLSLLGGPGMHGQDALAVGEIAGSVECLLEYQAVLPAGLVAMLRDYLPQMADRGDGRWEGAGVTSRALRLCEHVGWDIAAGDLRPGDRVSLDRSHCYPRVPAAIAYRAMQVLAARGEVTRRAGGYYVRGPGGHGG
jgi:hypothetical protein